MKPIPYDVWDFDFMAEHGFDFVRLAVDYRRWTPSGEAALAEIDRAIAWARERRIYVDLDLHNAPGYDDFSTPRLLTLWQDGDTGDEMRREFAAVWRGVAARYKAIPSSELSFNLINEPPDITPAAYRRAAGPAIGAIREVDPRRLIICDGIQWGNVPVPELVPFEVAQATRGYQPMRLTHYRASWIEGSDQWPLPAWPLPPTVNAILAGPYHKEFSSPLVLRGPFASGATVAVTIHTVSHGCDLVVRADGAQILRRTFQPGPGAGEWKTSTYRPQYQDYEAVYDRTYTTTLDAAVQELSFGVEAGDWLTFSDIRIHRGKDVQVIVSSGTSTWGEKQDTYALDATGAPVSTTRHAYGTDDLWRDQIEPWRRLQASGVGVHVGEWGAHNVTPHDVVLRWMTDVLDNFRRAGWGWALWDLRGSFGPVDSERKDVAYEDYKGHKLDRAMLDLLKSG